MATIMGLSFAAIALYAAWTTQQHMRVAPDRSSHGLFTVGVVVLALTTYWLLKVSVFLGLVVGQAVGLVFELFSFIS